MDLSVVPMVQKRKSSEFTELQWTCYRGPGADWHSRQKKGGRGYGHGLQEAGEAAIRLVTRRQPVSPTTTRTHRLALRVGWTSGIRFHVCDPAPEYHPRP